VILREENEKNFRQETSMKMKKYLNWRVVLTALVCCVVVLVLTHKSHFERLGLLASEKFEKKVPLTSTSDKETVEKVLTKWVYEHSKQISLNTSKEIVKESMKTNKPLLMLALIEVESNFVPTAVSNKGAIGLTQVMPVYHEKSITAKGIIKERRDLFDVVPSIQAGNFVLDSCLTQSKGDVSKALESYLGGQDKWYVNRILSNLANLYMLTVLK